jgi:hypothetical protein
MALTTVLPRTPHAANSWVLEQILQVRGLIVPRFVMRRRLSTHNFQHRQGLCLISKAGNWLVELLHIQTLRSQNHSSNRCTCDLIDRRIETERYITCAMLPLTSIYSMPCAHCIVEQGARTSNLYRVMAV